ncbi:hypothetical protein LOK49_LG06G02017, partial [Camellia lanceoleosa]
AFMKAWEAVCKATGALTLIVPAGKNFLLTPITFGGHIVAPSSLSQWQEYNNIQNWLSFSFVNGLIINGGGQINGQGSIWWGGLGYERNITFEELTLFEVENPIIINQNYCDHQANKVCRNETSTVQISEVTYRNMGGSSISGKAINLRCGESQACTNIVTDRVNIYSSVPENKTFSFCCNACGTSFSTTPSVPCLSNC